MEMLCVLAILWSPEAVFRCIALGPALAIHNRWLWWFFVVIFSLVFDFWLLSMVPSWMHIAMFTFFGTNIYEGNLLITNFAIGDQKISIAEISTLMEFSEPLLFLPSSFLTGFKHVVRVLTVLFKDL